MQVVEQGHEGVGDTEVETEVRIYQISFKSSGTHYLPNEINFTFPIYGTHFFPKEISPSILYYDYV